METMKKVGIYRDTRDPDTLCLVVRTHENTLYFRFSESEFVDGWFEYDFRHHQRTTRGRRHSPNMKAVGSLRAMQAKSPTPLHPLFCDALLSYHITPTLLTHLDKTSAKRIKWVGRKKGGWGGPRTKGKKTKGQGKPTE